MEPDVNSAIRKGYFQQVRFLVQFGHSVNSRDEERRTPLMNCALVQEGRWGLGLARILMEKGAVMAYRDKRGMNALHYACIYDRKELVQMLLNSPDFDIMQGDLMGNTALHYAGRKGNTAIVTLLVRAINKYALKIDKANRKGVTALMEAWKLGQESTARVLIEEGQADETLRESVEQKTAKDFQEEFRNRQEQERQMNMNLSNKYGRVMHRRMRPMSAGAMSTMSTVTCASSRPFSRARPKSAALLGRRRKPSGMEDEPEQPDPLDIIEKEKNAGKIYKSASCNDLRNKPEYILNISPIECFVAESQYRTAQAQPSRVLSGIENQAPQSSWKSDMKNIYTTFDFQFTKSYCTAAKARDPDSQEYERMGSPNPSDCESLRDPAALDRASRRAGRKIAVKTAMSLSVDSKAQRKGSGKAVPRKISNSSNSSLKTQLTTTDTSSYESVNSSIRSGKTTKRSQSSSSDNKDDLSEVGLAEKTSKARSRKISSSSNEDRNDGLRAIRE